MNFHIFIRLFKFLSVSSVRKIIRKTQVEKIFLKMIFLTSLKKILSGQKILIKIFLSPIKERIKIDFQGQKVLAK